MSIKDITNPEWVKLAMAEYQERGEVAFLERYGFGPATKFHVLDGDGNRYPPKAILGVAHRFIKKGSKALTAHQLIGGEPTNKPLRELGFKIAPKEGMTESLLPADSADNRPFDPADIKDARARIERTIVQRRGQALFRKALLDAYGRKCAISGCEIADVLEAAHIYPYRGAATNDVQNGLLLRADLHTLFDLNLIAIEPKSHAIRIASGLGKSEYAKFDGKKISIPSNRKEHPSEEALRMHWEEFEV